MVAPRPFTYDLADYGALSNLLAAVWPDRDSSIPALQHADRHHRDGYFFQRIVIEVNHTLVALCDYGEPADSYRPGKYAVDLAVAPAWRGHGFGATLYEQMLCELGGRAPTPTLLACRTREDQPQSVRFLAQRGFTQVMRSPMSRLDVNAFDFVPFAGVIPKVAASGIQLYSLAQLAMIDANWRQKVYELDWECTLDEPLPDTPTQSSFEHYAAEVFENPDFLPEAWFVAVDAGVYVGMTATNRNGQNPRQLDTVFTGIVRSHRRRGLATALKLRAIDYAQKHGYATILADNEEHNPMVQINLALGFAPQPALLFFHKHL